MKNKNLIIFLLLIISSCNYFNISAQNPIIEWSKCSGGTDGEAFGDGMITADGGYISVGGTISNDGDVSGNHGGQDIWVLKSNVYGGIEWQVCLGGSGSDVAGGIDQSSDGGFIVGGYTESTDGNVTFNHGDKDCWVVKLDANGFIEWQKTYGGTLDDRAHSIAAAADGGYIFAGYTRSNDGDVTGNHGIGDEWVVKIDSVGDLIWQKCYGGLAYDEAFTINRTNDGGYIIGGTTQSNDGDVSGSNGNQDCWAVKIDSTGIIQWQKCAGGSQNDCAYFAMQVQDGGYVFTGWTQSSDGNVTGYHNNNDAWTFKLDASGSLSWQNSLGGNGDDLGSGIDTTSDGGLMFIGSTTSTNGDITSWHGSEDIWMVKLNSGGILLWQVCFGGNLSDAGVRVQQTPDGGYLIYSSALSNNSGDIIGGLSSDFWMAKIKPRNSVSGFVFLDDNQNGVRDIGENGFSESLVYSSSNNYSYLSQPDLSGFFYTLTDSDSVSTTLHNFNLQYYTFTPNQHSSVFTSYNSTDSVNFAISPIPGITDLRIHIVPIIPPRPGFNATYSIFYQNAGTDTIANGDVYYVYNPNTFVMTTTPFYTFSNGVDSLGWSYTNLLPGEIRYIHLTVYIAPPPAVNVGDYLISSASVEPSLGDTVPGDNLYSINQLVVGSYDPNNKCISGGPYITTTQVSNGEYLYYTINFQNTGSDTAFTIKVVDTLDLALDGNTLEVMAASHNCQLSIENGRNIKWVFKNILLPDSNINEPASHGFVSYRVKPLSTTPAGTIIENKADIFFDYNVPVATNTVQTPVVNPNGIQNQTRNNLFDIYPNPATETINIATPETNKKCDIIITSITGKIVYESTTHSTPKTSISTRAIAPGVYFLQIQTENHIETKKLVVIK
ncbi:MAG: T9SS type A sorting domain-containing protein [Bacteroidia bacterium]